MHKALLKKLRKTEGGVTARFASTRGSFIGFYDEHGSGPIWVSKSVSDPVGIRRLRAEYEALAYLEPCASELRIPRIVDWVESSDGCTLIQSGVPGKHNLDGISTTASAAELNRLFGGVVNWVNRFQQLVPAPKTISVEALAACYADELERRDDLRQAAGPLIQILRKPGPVGQRSAVAVHGDLFTRNVLFQGAEVGVVDWAGFASGFPLQDKFSYVVNNDYWISGRCGLRLQGYHHVFFSRSQACKFMLGLIKGAGWNKEQAYSLFYCFLATQICLDSDLIPLQDWLDILGYLEKHGYPGPGTNLPAPYFRQELSA